MSKKLFSLAVLIFFLCLILANSFIVKAESQPKTYIQLSKSSITMKAGQVIQVNASLKNQTKSAKNITKLASWNAENKSILSIEAGRINALKEGSTTITVTYNSYKASMRVTINPEKTLLRIELSEKTVNFSVGDELQITAAAIYSDKTIEDITAKAEWSVSDTSIAQVNKGKLTAVAQGSASIKVLYKNSKAEGTVNVSEDVSLLGLEASSSDISLIVGQEKQITITANYSDDTTKDMTNQVLWSTENSDIAIAVNGKIKALKPGKVLIKATLEDCEAYINVEVLASQDNHPGEVGTETSDNTTTTPSENVKPEKKLLQIKLSNQSMTLKANDTSVLTATATYSDGSSEDITNKVIWSSENSNIASVSTGTVTATSPGLTSIKASYSNIVAVCSIMVTSSGEKTIIGLRFSTFSLTIKVGEVSYLSANVIYSDGSTEDVSSKASWSVESAKVASVTMGKVTGVSGGNAVVKATYEGKITYANVKVTN